MDIKYKTEKTHNLSLSRIKRKVKASQSTNFDRFIQNKNNIFFLHSLDNCDQYLLY